MFTIPSDFLSVEVLAFVLPSAFVCVAMGAYLGYCFALNRIPRQIAKEREKTVAALKTMLRSTDQLTEDVGHHNSELKSVEQSVSGLEQLKSFDVHTRKEDGTIRTSLHLRTGN